MDDSFVKAPVAVPKLSGFDKSHQNLLTSKVGTITPILVDELIPGSKVHLKMALSASLPPLASDTFMRCSIKTECFYVPMRLLTSGFEAWFTDEPKNLVGGFSSGVPTTSSEAAYLPIMMAPSSGSPTFLSEILANGSLADYLGYRAGVAANLNDGVSAMPFLAYHRIWNDWYRNSLVQKEAFLPAADNFVNYGACSSPSTFLTSNDYIWNTDNLVTCADGVRITQLRQRNFGLDYFTTATPNKQQGTPMTVSFNTSGATGSFSIETLRQMNSMQQFKERNNLLGNLYVEQVYGRYGVRPSDGIAQRSLYLGRGEFEVYSKGIFAATNPVSSDGWPSSGDSSSGYNSANPFGSVASRYGNAYASGSDFLVNFEAKEPGYLFVMATLVPRVTYSTGIDRYLKHYIGSGSITDMANPILQNVGPQAILQQELTGAANQSVFGYTDRYAEFKTKQDSLHGLLRDGQTLEAFALQRSFATNATPQINTSFLEIPTDYMDNVTAVKQWVSDYGYWLDSYFDYRVSMPLSKYSLPSLQDPAYEHGKTIVVNKGGSKL